LGPPYLSDRDESGSLGPLTVSCQRVDKLAATVKQAWALVQAFEYINSKFPRPPVP